MGAGNQVCMCVFMRIHRLWLAELPCMLLSSALPNYAPALSLQVLAANPQ
jgi:hypothetical protein